MTREGRDAQPSKREEVSKRRSVKEERWPAFVPLGLVVLAVVLAIFWNRGSSTGFNYTTTPPTLLLSPTLNAQCSDFDSIYERLWADKRSYVKYAFDAGSISTRLVNVSVPGVGPTLQYVDMHFAITQVEGRKHRPFNPVAELHEVVQPFTNDNATFNFNKKDVGEVLFTIDLASPHATPRQDSGWTGALAGVLVNSHPFAGGCVVVIVRTDRRLPQVLTREAVEVGLLLAAQSTAGLRIGYNSLAGGASVNHLHFQGWYYSNATPDGRLAVESAPYAVLRTAGSGLTVSQSQGYPIRSLLFSAPVGVGLEELSSTIFACVDDLLRHNIPHNLIFADGGRRAYIIPRKFMIPNKWRQTIGFPEVAGQIITVSDEAFAGLSESPAAVLELLAPLSLEEDAFAGLVERCVFS